jgi:hypothetical protein
VARIIVAGENEFGYFLEACAGWVGAEGFGDVVAEDDGCEFAAGFWVPGKGIGIDFFPHGNIMSEFSEKNENSPCWRIWTCWRGADSALFGAWG